MNNNATRRGFLRGSMLAAVGTVVAQAASPTLAFEPFKRTRGSRLKLSSAAYSYRDQLTGKDKTNPLTLEQMIDQYASLGCEGVELTSYYFPTPPSDAFLIDLKRKCFLRGLDVSGMPIRTDFCQPSGPKRDEQIAQTKTWIEKAAVLGAPCIRIFAGGDANGDIVLQRKYCVESLSACLEYAAKYGIFLVVENHGGIVTTPDMLMALVKDVSSEWFGVNLDSGNFHTPDPYADLARVAPYAATVQMKTEMTPQGGQKSEMDFKRVLTILRDAGYRGYVALEYEGAEPAPTAVPRYLKKLRSLIDEVNAGG